MNKIIVDTDNFEKQIEEDLYLEVLKTSTINLKVDSKKGINLLIIVRDNNIKVNLDLVDNTSLIINSLGINSSINYDVKVSNNIKLLVSDSIITSNDSINNINIYDNGANNLVSFYTNGINLENSKLYFNLNGIVKESSVNSNLNEYSKIINIKDGDSKIIPNLIIDTKEVIANHSAYIGTFSKNDLYYLESRGIPKKYAKRLLIKSILLSNMTIEKEILTKIVSEFIGIGGDVNE